MMQIKLLMSSLILRVKVGYLLKKLKEQMVLLSRLRVNKVKKQQMS